MNRLKIRIVGATLEERIERVADQIDAVNCADPRLLAAGSVVQVLRDCLNPPWLDPDRSKRKATESQNEARNSQGSDSDKSSSKQLPKNTEQGGGAEWR
jgi:hypothetical protein